MQVQSGDADNVEIQVEAGFNLNDILNGIKNAKDLYGVHIEEENNGNKSQRDLLKKYAELSILQQFLKSFDTSVFGKLSQVNE